MIFKGKELKEGDRLHDQRHGIGKVVAISKIGTYPIVVKFESYTDSYTPEGRIKVYGPIYLDWPKFLQYLCRDDNGKLFITQDYFESKQEAERVMICKEVIREIPESAIEDR